MKNVTNGLNNLSKPKDKREYNLKVSYGELVILRSLLANSTTNPSFPVDRPEQIKFVREAWDLLNHMIEKAKANG